MAGNSEGSIQRESANSTAATHPETQEEPLVVGPSTEKEFNTLRARLIPKACFKLEDSNFEFDSSFITILTFDVGPLKDLLDKHPGSKLSIFGHADPVGRDDYNKTLSGRRAQAIFGLLVRKVDLWEDLYFHHDSFSGKDEWGVRSIQLMLNQVGPTKTGIRGELDAETKQALKDFEQKEGLSPKGFNSKKEVAAETFRKLTSLYMDFICKDDALQDFRLKPDDFLARGQGKDGKGDFQGCGEFNPLMIFSKQEKNSFDREENHKERNEENQTNRRVMILLFRPGSQVDPEKWPCPSAKEGVEGCRKRLFSDAEKRRGNQAERREFQKTKDTFACRFYHRLLESSPCERVLASFTIRLFDPAGKPLPGAPFLIVTGARRITGEADANADAIVRDLRVPTTCAVSWSRPSKDRPTPAKPEEFDFQLDVHVDIDGEDGAEAPSDEASLKRLQNFGYTRYRLLEENVKEFQIDIGKSEDEITGRLADIKDELKRRHDSLAPPERGRRLGTV
jgi:outer membrane protein OmpA-like peptidoglycan-associated protein